MEDTALVLRLKSRAAREDGRMLVGSVGPGDAARPPERRRAAVVVGRWETPIQESGFSVGWKRMGEERQGRTYNHAQAKRR